MEVSAGDRNRLLGYPFPPNCPVQVSQGIQSLELDLEFEIGRQHPLSSPMRIGLLVQSAKKMHFGSTLWLPQGTLRAEPVT